MAAGPATGHLFSQVPQPIQRSATTRGSFKGWSSRVVPFSKMMALSGRGQTSWQTMQARLSPQAMQHDVSIVAQPMT